MSKHPSSTTFRVAVLDLYQGTANQGMRGIQSILKNWSQEKNLSIQVDYFEVRIKLVLITQNYQV